MNHDAPRAPAREQAKLRIESLPFAKVPNQSRLFLDYVSDPTSLRKYYPNAVASPREVAGFASQVRASHLVDRDTLCDALAEFNEAIGAGEATQSSIERLRNADTVTVVTGQQAGLFTGPLYTIYKALSAVKLAQQLSAAGTLAVPVFWVASEDHDLDEVARTFFIGTDGDVVESRYKPESFVESSPVGDVMIDASIGETLDNLDAVLNSPAIRDELSKAWSPGISYAHAFARNLALLLGKLGLIVIDPLQDKVKRLSSPIYREAVAHSAQIVTAIRDRSSELVRDGYEAQVLVEEDYFPLFWHADDGRRVALRKVGDDIYRAKGVDKEFTLPELVALSEKEPHRLSPGVMLRPVVQDYLLPTVCYFGGAAEIAYFAQNSEAYRVLGRPATPIMHRQSFTVVEAKHARTFEKLGIGFEDMFDGIEPLMQKTVERVVSPETAVLFAEVEAKINAELDRLDQELSQLDPTLADNLATRRRKIVYHIAALKKKAYRAQMRKAETVDRRIRSAFDALLPNGQLQERVLNVHSFLSKYGPGFFDRMYDAVDLDDNQHRIVYI